MLSAETEQVRSSIESVILFTGVFLFDTSKLTPEQSSWKADSMIS
jgi:hypothetical protein